MRLYILLTLLLFPLVLPCRSAEIPKHLAIAMSYAGTIEKGHNSGVVIDYIIKKGGGNKGYPYCAYFVHFCLDSAKVKLPVLRSGLATQYITKQSISTWDVIEGRKKVEVGMIAIWRRGTTRYGHIGFVHSWDGKEGFVVEANTSQNGIEGIWLKKEIIQPLNYFRIIAFTPVIY